MLAWIGRVHAPALAATVGDLLERGHLADTADCQTLPRATDPLGDQQGDNHVIRGARWTQSRLAELRLSYRDYGQARRDDVGFRVARYAE